MDLDEVGVIYISGGVLVMHGYGGDRGTPVCCEEIVAAKVLYS